MSEQARIDELALQLAEGIINTLSNATMPAPQRKARCQVLIAEALASERNDLKQRIQEMEESVPPVYTEIVNERREQDKQWGGPEHDDTHEPLDWLGYITHQCQKTKTISHTADNGKWIFGPSEDYRERLIKIAALAIAAVESYDRKAPVYKLYEDMYPEEQRSVDELGYAIPLRKER